MTAEGFESWLAAQVDDWCRENDLTPEGEGCDLGDLYRHLEETDALAETGVTLIPAYEEQTLFIVGQGYFIHFLPHIGQVADNGQYRHQFGTGGDAESRLHRDAVFTSAVADCNISQCLGAEIHDPVEFDTVRVDIQPPHVCQSLKVFVIVITFVLHSGGQSYHRQVVGIHNIVHVTGQAHREFGHRN